MSLRKWYSNRQPRNTQAEDDEIEKVFKLLEEGEEKIVLDENHKNPIFTLGNTGSGKSTLVQFIATDNKALHAEETFPGSNEYIIVDDNETIGGGITSQTTFPILVIDEVVGAAYYDCPGFNDTRSPGQEIAASYFIKKVFDFAEELKIVLTVNYSSVRPGVERKDFMDLLKHTTTLVKDIAKFEGCISVFVTKVENQYVKNPNGDFVLVSDENVISNIANYLESVKKEIQEKVPADDEETKFFKSAVKLIEIFLTKDTAGNHARIGIFRRPDEAGPILEIELLQERKPGMKKIIYEGIKFTKKGSDDFGHTISDTAKLQVGKMVDRITLNVSTEIDNVVKILDKYNQDVGDQIENIIKSMATDSSAAVDEVLASDLASKVSTSFDAITKLKADVVQAKTIKDIAEAIKVCGTAMKSDTEAAVVNLMRQDNYFEFLQNVNGGLNIGDYSKSFDGILVNLTAIKKAIDKDSETTANTVKEKVKANVNKVPNALITCYDEKFESLSIEELVTAYEKQHKIVVEFAGKIKTINSLQELSKEITNMVSKSEIESTEVNAASLEIFNYGNYLTVLNIFKKEVVVWSPDWIKPFEGHADYVFKTQKWYNFLQKLYVKLSAYTYFQYRERYDVANIDDWGKDGKPQGIKITKANYTKFLEKINETDETIKKMDVNDKILKELNRVLELTIKQDFGYQITSDGNLTVTGVLLKLSDFIGSDGKIDPKVTHDATVKVLNINATDTLFVDQDLTAVGETLKMNVVASKWEIIGTRTFNLNGTNATSEGSAADATNPSGSGENGKAGGMGGPGGDFVGVGYEFKAAENLTVTSNGGQGGKGQKGGNGANGSNGRDAENNDNFEHVIYGRTNDPNWTKEFYRYYGKDGGVGGNGGNGGAGGEGGQPGSIEIKRNDGNTSLPKTRADKGSKGQGGDGGSGAQGGKRGNDLEIVKHCTMFDCQWREDTRKVVNRTERAANGSNGKTGASYSAPFDAQQADPINIAEAVNNFEFYLRQYLHDRFVKQTAKKFLDSLSHDIYNTKTLAGNLSNLESQLIKLDSLLTNDEIIYLYQSIIDRTTEYSKNPKSSEATKEYEKALKYIQTAALCQIQVRKDSFAPNLIIDVTRYLDNVLKDVNILKDLKEKANKLKVVNEAKEKFKGNIDKKIEEAQSFIENEILPEIDNINKQLDDQIDKLIAEVIKLQEEAVIEREKLIEKKRQLANALMLNLLFGVFKMASQFMGPIGKLGGLASSIAETATSSLEFSRGAYDNESIKEGIKDAKEEIKEAKSKMPDVDMFGDLYEKYKGDKKKIETIDEAIAATEAKLKALHEYEKQIYDTMVPMLDDVEKMLDEVSKQLESQSQVSLDVSKWKVQSTLRDVKSQLKQMTRGFSVEDDIARCIEKLEEAMTAQINLYDRIQSYQDQKNLADYIAIVSTGVDESNPELAETLTTLEIMIRSNLVLYQHKQAVNAVTQNVFPFAHLYLNSTYLAFSVKSEETLDEVVAEAVKQLNAMKANIEKYKTSIGKQDEYITSSLFNSDLVSVKPFYVWSKQNYKNIISALLSGKKVILYTDVRRDNTDKFAIKFNLSEINFKAPSKEIQAEINEKIKKFKVNMTHLGSSYYRFKESVYIIYSESQSIQYTFERGPDGNPAVFNAVYEKIKNGDLMLSPFAMWEMQLTNAVSEGDFKDLEKFKDQVDLELVGKGNYVTQNLDVGVLNVEQYYKPEPTMLANDMW